MKMTWTHHVLHGTSRKSGKKHQDTVYRVDIQLAQQKGFKSRSKAKATPRRSSTSCSSSRTVPILESTWIDIEPGAQFDQAYPVAKRLYTLLRHGELSREEDGAIEFWRLKDDLRNKFEHSQHRSDDVWKNKMAGGGQKLFTSELFKAIQDQIPLILHCRTMS